MALKIDIIQVANAMHELAKAVRAVHVRISIDDMFALTLPVPQVARDLLRMTSLVTLLSLSVAQGCPEVFCSRAFS